MDATDYANYLGFQEPDADKSVLRDSRGVIMTRSLFLEAQDWAVKKKGKIKPLYSLTEDEREGLPSAYQIYMHSVDEYDAAMKLVGSMRHWRKLCKLDWFLEGIPDKMFEGLKQWREDMKYRDASTAKRQLMSAANSTRGDTAAARKILDMSVDKAAKRPVGAPKKTKEPEDNGAQGRVAALHAAKVGGSQ